MFCSLNICIELSSKIFSVLLKRISNLVNEKNPEIEYFVTLVNLEIVPTYQNYDFLKLHRQVRWYMGIKGAN